MDYRKSRGANNKKLLLGKSERKTKNKRKLCLKGLAKFFKRDNKESIRYTHMYVYTHVMRHVYTHIFRLSIALLRHSKEKRNITGFFYFIRRVRHEE